MKKSFFLVVIVGLVFMLSSCHQKTQIIAHRGYWQSAGSAENSIHSLQAADNIGVYGSEFDVHLTADNVLLVFHDNTVQGMNLQKVNYSQLAGVRLKNGEPIPTLEKYLEVATKLKVHLIFELKAHQTPERNREAARLSWAMVKRYNLQERTSFISFDLDAVKEFIHLSPKSKVYYLKGDLSPQQLKGMGFAGLDYSREVMAHHPDWFKEAQRNGMEINVWTVDDLGEARRLMKKGADFITTNKPESMQELLNK